MTLAYNSPCLFRLFTLPESIVMAISTLVPLSTPSIAAAVGFNTQTFGSTSLGTDWIKWPGNPGAVNATQNADGTVTILGGGNTYNDQIETNQTFGGGGYFQATMSFPNNPQQDGWPSFWGNTAHDNQSHNIEVDYLEVQGQQLTHGTIDWTSAGINTATFNNVAQSFPAGTDFSKPHTYGMLWVPGQKLTFYFDGKQLPNDTSLAAGSPYSVLDQQHLNLILGTGPTNPMTVYNVSVWQASGANDTLPVPSAPSPPPPPPTATPSPNDTVVLAGQAKQITDASGNAWTITAGATVAINGAPAATSAFVTEIAYVNNTVWQENQWNEWWGWDGNGWNLGNGTTTSPLPADLPPPPVASPNDTVILAGSTAAITDSTGNAWTITSGATVAVNGAPAAISAFVTEIAYVNGTVWQENQWHEWWGWDGKSWNLGNGTTTSPLPAAPPPPPVFEPPGIIVSAGDGSTPLPPAAVVSGDTFDLSTSAITTATLGAKPSFLTFTGGTGVNVTGGRGASIITSTAGNDTYTAGKGSMDVTGGTGADAYVFHANSSFLSIEDFSAAKGDTLTVDKSLQASMKQTSDGDGGTFIAFGGRVIDVVGVATVPTTAIHWA